MSILDTDDRQFSGRRHRPEMEARTGIMGLHYAYVYLAITAFCALLGFIYEHFSHGVYSYYMLYSFVVPLVFCGFWMLMAGPWKSRLANRAFRFFSDAAAATLTVGMVLEGVLEIYGTDNSLMKIYLYAGAGLLIIAVLVFIISNAVNGKEDQ